MSAIWHWNIRLVPRIHCDLCNRKAYMAHGGIQREDIANYYHAKGWRLMRRPPEDPTDIHSRAMHITVCKSCRKSLGPEWHPIGPLGECAHKPRTDSEKNSPHTP